MQGKSLIRPLFVGLLTVGVLSLSVIANANTISVAKSTDGIIAAVNDEIILKSELIAASAILAAQYQANNINATPQQIQHTALDGLINRKLQLDIINRAGITTDEAAINRQLLQIAHSQGLDSLTKLQSSLESKQKGSYAALRKQLIEDAAIGALWQHQVATRINISDQEIDAFLNSPDAASILQSQYRLIHIRIPYQSNATDTDKARTQAVANQVAISLQNGDALSVALEKTKGYEPQPQVADTGLIHQDNIPEHIATQISNLPVGGVTQPITTDAGIDVVKLVAKNDNAQIIIPEWQTSHILVRADDAQNSAMAEQKINAIYDKLQKGADFANLATTYSDDTASAQQHGSLGWVSEGQMVPEFENIMKNTKKGDYSTPFRSQFGWHILKVEDTRERDVTEQYRKNAAREMIFNRIAPQAEEDWLQQMRAGAYIKIFD